MRFVAQWLPLLLCSWAGSAGAATDCSGSFAINSRDDVATLNACTTFTGNISLAAKGIQDVTLNGLEAVTGYINIADSDAVLSISSTTLKSISTLTLNNLPKLTTLTLPALTNISKLDFTGLTSLKGCEIGTGTLEQDVSEISIINTALEKLDWLKWPVATALTIAANMNLVDFTLPYDKISAGSSYQFSINRALSNLDFSRLTEIQGSLAVNGNKGRSLNFDKLEAINGYVRLSGPFSNLTMPRLAAINGALRAESTVDILAFCNWLSVQARLYGHYDCTANNTEPLASSTTSMSPSNTAVATPTSAVLDGDKHNNKSKSNLSTGAIIGVAVAMVVVISVILTATALWFFRRRSRNRAASQVQEAATGSEEKKTRSTSTLGEDLDASGVRYELGGRHTTHELQGAGPVTELGGRSLQELDCEKPYFRDHKPAADSPTGRFELP
ncbi:hypothetical protein OPT61_g2185 [Boeremia exigua]|uniref:Uncharacterized protein n=1 Tax=Boeremia exigua TaxID=749465 RepID=A0ACC2IMH3_9PLEO|nr:hypothetical protein OPT61_g2185 [Boeremia exigua]